MARIEHRDLVIFLAIARHKNFGRAAAEVGCSPSALSHALKILEGQLDVRLFNRTTRSVALTDAGERLFSRLAPAFLDIDNALDDLNSFKDSPSGTLRLNAAHASVEMTLLPLVTKFMSSHPNINVEIMVDNSRVDTVSAGFDAGVRLGESIAQDMIALPLESPLRSAFVATPIFFEKYPVPEIPEHLKNIPCIRLRFESGKYYHWEFESSGIRKNIEVKGSLTLSSQELAIQAALDGIGIAFAFEKQVKHHLDNGTLVRVLEEWSPKYPGHHLYYPGRKQVPSPLKAFIDFVRNINKEPPP